MTATAKAKSHRADKKRVPVPGSEPAAAAVAPRSVAEAVDDLLRLCLRKVSADAAVVMLPDQNLWCVAGGVSLGERERTLRLDPDNWLLNQVAKSDSGVIIEKTDTFRAQLAFTPLVQWRTLIAVSIPSVHGLLIVARAQNAFTKKELRAIARTTTRGCGPLVNAAQSARTIDLTAAHHRVNP